MPAQSDADLFAEGRIALDSHHDCAAAKEVLLKMTSSAMNSPLWLSYMGRSEECLKKFSRAISYYEQYNQAVPGQIEIINKLGDLRYTLGLLNGALPPLFDWIKTTTAGTMTASLRDDAGRLIAKQDNTYTTTLSVDYTRLHPAGFEGCFLTVENVVVSNLNDTRKNKRERNQQTRRSTRVTFYLSKMSPDWVLLRETPQPPFGKLDDQIGTQPCNGADGWRCQYNVQELYIATLHAASTRVKEEKQLGDQWIVESEHLNSGDMDAIVYVAEGQGAQGVVLMREAEKKCGTASLP